MNCKNIGIIGRVAEGTDLYDGQTIKTRILCNELRSRFPDKELICVDTHNYKKRAIITLFNTLKCFLKCKTIFLLVSANGMKFYFPFIYYLNKLFKRKIIHDCIGGNLHLYVEKNSKWVKYLSSFSYNLVELDHMTRELCRMGVKNVLTVPNFKRLTCVDINEMKAKTELPLKCCTFSRVCRQKGIVDAIECVEKLNSEYGKTVATLDVYGQIEPEFENEFDSILCSCTNTIRYKGKISFDKSVDELKKYDVLLFLTVFKGEGFPGTVLDAYASALPIIASDWRYNPELITEGKTGFLYDHQHTEQLYAAIKKVVDDPCILQRMRMNCLKEYSKYSADAVMDRIVSLM